MIKAAHLISLFLAGCVATSLLGTVATMHPAFLRFSILLSVVVAVIWLLAWLLDDWVISFLQLERFTYYSVLISFAVAALVGGGVALWMSL